MLNITDIKEEYGVDKKCNLTISIEMNNEYDVSFLFGMFVYSLMRSINKGELNLKLGNPYDVTRDEHMLFINLYNISSNIPDEIQFLISLYKDYEENGHIKRIEVIENDNCM